MKTYLIIDKFTISRETLCSLIHETNSDCIVHQANTIDEAEITIEKNGQVDCIIFNPTYLQFESNVYIKQLKRLSPQAKILVISHTRDYQLIQDLLACGADATVTINSSKDEIAAAIRSLQKGQSHQQKTCINHKEIKTKLPLNNDAPNNKVNTNTSDNFNLTNRQKEVLDYVTKGYANKLIAYELGVSEGTIKLHVSSILRALKVTNRTEAAMRAGQFYQSVAH